MNSEQVQRHLRYRLIGLLHVERLRRGDLLPSIRGIAKELGADHRAVANAYRVLEQEGLVEIRPGSGVYLAGDASTGAVESETGRWLSGLLTEGWNRGISRVEVAALVDRCAGETVRCACVESNQDHMTALAAELTADFSLDVQPVMVSPDAGTDAIPALDAADLVVTSVFHGAAVRAAAERAGKPCVVASLNPAFAAEVNRLLSAPEVTGVIADPLYAERAREFLQVTPHHGRVRLVLADELGGPSAQGLDLDSERVLVTRAARRRLGLSDYHLVPPPPPYVSPTSARALYECIVSLRLRGAPPVP